MADILTAIAFDPGPKQSSWCLATVGHEPRRRVRFEMAGVVDSRDRASIWLVIGGAGSRAIVGVEKPSGYVFGFARAPGLLETANVAGSIATIARSRGHRVLELPAPDVRRAVCGKRNPSDAIVKAAVCRLVARIPVRSNAHVRDALALCIVCLMNPGAAK